MLKNLKGRIFGKGPEAEIQADSSQVSAEETTAGTPEANPAQVAATINFLASRVITDAAKIAVLGGPTAYLTEPEIVRLTTMLQAKANVLAQLTGSSAYADSLVRATSGKLSKVGEEGVRFVRELLGAENLVGALISSEVDAREIFATAIQNYQQQILASARTIDE